MKEEELAACDQSETWERLLLVFINPAAESVCLIVWEQIKKNMLKQHLKTDIKNMKEYSCVNNLYLLLIRQTWRL